MTYRVWHSATIVIPDGSDTNSAGEPCEPGQGCRAVAGYVDQSWSRWEVYGKREDVCPDEFDPTACHEKCRRPDCKGCLTPAEWLALRLDTLPGGPDSWDGGTTFYASDSDTNHSPTGNGETALRAIHAEGFEEKALRAAWYTLQAWYAEREKQARDWLESQRQIQH